MQRRASWCLADRLNPCAHILCQGLPFERSHALKIRQCLGRQLLNYLRQFRVFRRLIRYRQHVAEPSHERKIDGAAQLQGFFEGTEGLMVLFRERLVKIDASGTAFTCLDGHRDVDAPTGAALAGWLS